MERNSKVLPSALVMKEEAVEEVMVFGQECMCVSSECVCVSPPSSAWSVLHCKYIERKDQRRTKGKGAKNVPSATECPCACRKVVGLVGWLVSMCECEY